MFTMRDVEICNLPLNVNLLIRHSVVATTNTTATTFKILNTKPGLTGYTVILPWSHFHLILNNSSIKSP